MEIIKGIIIFLIMYLTCLFMAHKIVKPLFDIMFKHVLSGIICFMLMITFAVSYSSMFVYYIYMPNDEMFEWVILIALTTGLIFILLNAFLVKGKKDDE